MACVLLMEVYAKASRSAWLRTYEVVLLWLIVYIVIEANCLYYYRS